MSPKISLELPKKLRVEMKFRWQPSTRAYVSGREFDPSTAAESSNQLISNLAMLYHATQSGAEFEVAERGVSILPSAQSKCGYFQCKTGGSTGSPKSIRRSHLSWIKSFEVNRSRFELNQEDSFAVLGQTAHSLALYGVLEAAHIGADIHLLADLRPKSQMEWLCKSAVTIVYATPSQLRLLCGSTSRPTQPLLLRHILCGGGTLTTQDRNLIERILPNVVITEFYGASETSFITMSDGQTPSGSVGKAYPGVEIKIDGGEIWAKSPYLFEHYAVGNSTDTRWHDGYLTVGEMGHLDDDGNLFLDGRKNRMITIADQNVFPEEVETLLLSQPDITQCLILPVADPNRGHVLYAVVAGPKCTDRADRIVELCRETLGPLKTPRRVLFLEDFPLLPSGKPDIGAITAWTQGQK